MLSRHLGVDPSYGSSLFATLRALGRRAIIVVEDACASAGDDYHEFAVRKILPLLATVTTTDAVVAALDSRRRPPR